MKNFKALCMCLKRTWFAAMFLVLTSLLFAAGSAHAETTETFTGATGTTFGDWVLSGNASFISATQADGTSGTVVRLTSTSNNQAGMLVYNKPFSSAFGDTITFDYYMPSTTGADGIAFFLVDGTTTNVTLGKTGGTLGYGTNYTSTNGVPKAYAAVGFDRYGNGNIEFGNAAGTAANNGTRTQNNVVIVGSGDLLAGYSYLAGSVQSNIAGGWRKAEIKVTRGDGTNGCANGGVCLSARFSTDNGATWTQVYNNSRIDNITGQAALPDILKLGFSASTGSVTDLHYIDNIVIDLGGFGLDIVKAGTGTGTVTSTSNPTQTTQLNCGSTCTSAYLNNTITTLTATPDASSNFTGWSGGTGSAACTGTGTCAVTLTAASSITANFALNTYTVTANANGNGIGTVASDVGGISYTYHTNNTGTTTAINYGTNVVVTATAVTGSTVSWDGTCTTAGGVEAGNGTTTATCTFTGLTANKTATVTFTATGDFDSDGVSSATENSAPNNGDGNGDGTPDSQQANVASLPSATGNGYITVEVLTGGCNLSDVQALSPANIDSLYTYPYGLVGFRINCSTAQVRIYYHGTANLSGYTYRKYGPTPPAFSASSWYTMTGVTFGTTTIGGQTVATATFTLTDGQLGDDTGVDGVIYDQGGPGIYAVSIPTMTEWGMLIFMLLAGLGSIYYLRRRRA